MKRNLITLFVFSFCSVKAQWVSIPDSFFGKWLNTHGFTTCLQGNSTTGWQLDTTCSWVQNADTMDVGPYLRSLEGVQYFTNLKYLDCSGNYLTYIPPLPPLLEYFNCSYNYSLFTLPALPGTLQRLECASDSLTVLPVLPASLTYLDCHFNNFTQLGPFPQGLRYLYCHDFYTLNAIVSLPDSLRALRCFYTTLTSLPALPPYLEELDCSHNPLGQLPALPPRLKTLRCFMNQLSTLPVLPDSLQLLWCFTNQITHIDSLNKGLIEFHCAENQLHTLPPLPASLQILTCRNNLLDSLPALNAALQDLDCSQNNLTALPPLPPGLSRLNCQSNNLTALPELPDSLALLSIGQNYNLHCLPWLKRIMSFFFWQTGLTCVPNYGNVTQSMPSITAYPICDSANDIHGCRLQTQVHETENQKFNLFPNPASSSVTVSIPEELIGSTLTVTDIMGREINSVLLSTANRQLSTESYSNGIYFVSIRKNGAVFSQKLVVSR